jgi:hypothetical protein
MQLSEIAKHRSAIIANFAPISIPGHFPRVCISTLLTDSD